MKSNQNKSYELWYIKMLNSQLLQLLVSTITKINGLNIQMIQLSLV